jgi:hypothetical protein
LCANAHSTAPHPGGFERSRCEEVVGVGEMTPARGCGTEEILYRINNLSRSLGTITSTIRARGNCSGLLQAAQGLDGGLHDAALAPYVFSAEPLRG